MLSKIFCAACRGIEAFTVTIEVDISDGICFYLVGLPDNAIKESQQRIGSALEKFGYRIPGKRVVINMAPANIRKEGSAFDMPIALGIICAAGQIPHDRISQDRLNEFIILGELALDGSLRAIGGALPIAIHARDNGFKGCILPPESAIEASEVDGILIYAARNVKEVIDILSSPKESSNKIVVRKQNISDTNNYDNSLYDVDFADIKGQIMAKRGLEIAAAGSHNLIMIGSPGCGKTYLAKALKSILPPMSREEALETGKIYSIAGMFDFNKGLSYERPYRMPHHTSTMISLVGGGVNSLPGEISLAHNGVLFADELPEFGRNVLEALRQPLEDGYVTICRAKNKYIYPASFMFIATMNPCPCGRLYDQPDKCTCSSTSILKYIGRISEPLMDRIDLSCEMSAPSFNELSKPGKGEPSSEIRKRVISARNIQAERFKDENGVYCNAQMSEHMVQKYVQLDNSALELLRKAMQRLNLSARAYSRILKVARTIADLVGDENINSKHIAEAISYRRMDRESWGK
jgi:Mg chelatase-related protein